MLHGYYGSAKDEARGGYKIAALILAESGIASIRFDFTGLGDSTVDHANFTLDVGVKETKLASDYIASLPEVDANRIGVMGWSKGGGMAVLSADEIPLYLSQFLPGQEH
jgi:cephalosporin-C deacetylase-like acetyl esterase